jgi:hypothetical protein
MCWFLYPIRLMLILARSAEHRAPFFPLRCVFTILINTQNVEQNKNLLYVKLVTSQTPKIQVTGPYPPFLGIITSNSVACHSQLRGVCAKLIPPFGMQLRKIRPDAASDVVTHESASQHHIMYQILRDVFGSRSTGPTQKHSSSTSKK